MTNPDRDRWAANHPDAAAASTRLHGSTGGPGALDAEPKRSIDGPVLAVLRDPPVARAHVPIAVVAAGAGAGRVDAVATDAQVAAFVHSAGEAGNQE